MGLDVSEHGMWGYPEFYIPVPGGYGSEQNIQLGQQYVNREVIVTEGSEGDSMYVVQAGKVEVVKTAEDGGEHQLGRSRPASSSGRWRSSRARPARRPCGRSATPASSRSTRRRSSGGIQDNPHLAVNMLKTMSSRLREANVERTARSGGAAD